MKHYCIAEAGTDPRLPMHEVNSLQFTESVNADELIATTQIVENGKVIKLVGIRIPKKELSHAVDWLLATKDKPFDILAKAHACPHSYCDDDAKCTHCGEQQ
jgi:hypothetical protein